MGKQCIKCSVEKPLNDFYKDKRHVSGRQGYCKVCTKEKNKNRVIDKAKKTIYKANFKKKHPDYRKKYWQNKDNMRRNNALASSKKAKDKYKEKIPSGIYGIFYDCKLVYIGESIKPLDRSGMHFSKRTDLRQAKIASPVSYALSIGELERDKLRFKMFEFIDDTPTRKQREAALIQRYSPIYNSDMYSHIH